MIIAPWRLSAWHSFIDAKYSTWSKKSDANPPEGDTKPPEDSASMKFVYHQLNITLWTHQQHLAVALIGTNALRPLG